MTDSILHPSTQSFLPPRSDADAVLRLIRRLVWKLAIATLLLMAIGSATRVMNAGLACPDWPLCYGTLFPGQQMNLQVFLEWFHRLDASGIGLMAIALLGLSLWYRRTLPNWLPGAAAAALVLVIFQGVLGGLTVTQLLRFDIVTAHLGTALLFFVTLLVMGTALLPFPEQPIQSHESSGRRFGSLRWMGLAAAALVYGQSLLGGLVASQWSLHQCLAWSRLCGVMNSHLLGVVPPTLLIFALVGLTRGWSRKLAGKIVPNLSTNSWAIPSDLRALASSAGIFLLLQIGLGVATFRLRLQVELLTVCHQMVGAALLGSLVCFTVLAFRHQDAIPALSSNIHS